MGRAVDLRTAIDKFTQEHGRAPKAVELRGLRDRVWEKYGPISGAKTGARKPPTTPPTSGAKAGAKSTPKTLPTARTSPKAPKIKNPKLRRRRSSRRDSKRRR